tara:strand:+ start:4776 stop:5000 length:225 start_codon:yes stop_codon:yes gene_type:complete
MIRLGGLGIYQRTYSIPYNTDLPQLGSDTTRNTNITPLFYLESDYFFLRGQHGGVHIYRNNKFDINAMHLQCRR